MPDLRRRLRGGFGDGLEFRLGLGLGYGFRLRFYGRFRDGFRLNHRNRFRFRSRLRYELRLQRRFGCRFGSRLGNGHRCRLGNGLGCGLRGRFDDQFGQAGDGRGDLFRCLHMGFQGDRGKSQPFRPDVQFLVGNEEEMVLARGPEAPQAREEDHLPHLEDFLHLREELRKDALRHRGIHPVGTVGIDIHVPEKGIRPLPWREIQTTVRRIDRIALVRESGWHELRHETAHPRKGDRIVVQDRFLDHLCEEVDIHRSVSVRICTCKDSEKNIKNVWSFRKRLYLCNPETKQGHRKR